MRFAAFIKWSKSLEILRIINRNRKLLQEIYLSIKTTSKQVKITKYAQTSFSVLYWAQLDQRAARVIRPKNRHPSYYRNPHREEEKAKTSPIKSSITAIPQVI